MKSSPTLTAVRESKWMDCRGHSRKRIRDATPTAPWKEKKERHFKTGFSLHTLSPKCVHTDEPLKIGHVKRRPKKAKSTRQTTSKCGLKQKRRGKTKGFRRKSLV